MSNSQLNYMGVADAEDVRRNAIKEIETLGEGDRSLDQESRYVYLGEVVRACETVIGFLNGEHAAWKDANAPAPSTRGY